jgi:hypothetical protein
MKEKHYIKLGNFITKLATHDLPPAEKGRVIEGIYLSLEKEAERDARDEANGKYGN